MFLFLGGTVGKNRWREEIVIPALIERGVPEDTIFNPVVKHWDLLAQAREDEAKQEAMYQLYVIASPDPTGESAKVSGYSMVELLMGLYDAPEHTVACFITENMASHAAKETHKVMRDITKRFPNAPIFTSYIPLIEWLVDKFQATTQHADRDVL